MGALALAGGGKEEEEENKDAQLLQGRLAESNYSDNN